MIQTKLNTEMLVVVGPMGNDLAAFPDPVQALHFGINADRISHGENITYRRPDGETKRLCDFGDTRNQKEFEAWAKGDEAPPAAAGTAAALAERTADAYSFITYGRAAWIACCALLLRRKYSEREAEAILRSKWMRWAGDSANTDKPSAGDLARFLDNPRNLCTPNAVQELVTGTFTD